MKKSFWSLVELTIILVVLSILSAIIAPVISRYVKWAKYVRVHEDTQMLGCSIALFLQDTASPYFMVNPTLSMLGGLYADANRVDMLVGNGDIPAVGLGLALGDCWASPISCAQANATDTFQNHLITNSPCGVAGNGYAVASDTAPVGVVLGPDVMFAWRGPYVTAPVSADPWGNRYAANVSYLDPQPDCGACGAAYELQWINGELDVIVISAGNDEEIDTPFVGDGIIPGDDDVIYTVAAGAY